MDGYSMIDSPETMERTSPPLPYNFLLRLYHDSITKCENVAANPAPHNILLRNHSYGALTNGKRSNETENKDLIKHGNVLNVI